ncbi:hypothetical protein FHG66_12145 [Rubellimicrobium rubrum]|uniref:Uncharacterized protein n=1 Tax=Rubellimicrobium rubrum TaxID=2585369 RepID=A0A5C4MV01_9RHOB|nr:hypothetical protein [Rubellimicrobium rubrum]TNC49190.1 hypothetical protein FHG66_12145 [Rubellimicrobium rubrum]
MALRQAIGMMWSLPVTAGLNWPVPKVFIHCRKQQPVTIQVPCRRSRVGLDLLGRDASVTMGEVATGRCSGTALDGGSKGAGVHRPMDTATRDIPAVELRTSPQVDGMVLPDLLAQLQPDEPYGAAKADGA